jgi:tetratricopeptide (TPR) repeat protein
MVTTDLHESTISRGLEFHEGRQYKKALPYFRRACKATPQCAVAQYNFANTLYMLGRHGDATAILATLVTTPDSVLRAGCPLEENPRSFKVDAQFLLFLTTLYETGDWDRAFPFAKNHLSLRRRGLRSTWQVAEIHKEIRNLRAEFCEA